jgi:hypothetical protein
MHDILDLWPQAGFQYRPPSHEETWMGRYASWILAAVAFVIAAIGARPYAGGWNDGSRLAAVESIVDRGTLAIDGSVFCGAPQRLFDSGHLPYAADNPGLNQVGTSDKLFVRGQFHSDKPPLISLMMAGMYEPLMWLGAPSPGERPDTFAWIMTLLTSGLGYAVSIGCLWTLGGRLNLEPRWRAIWLASFALATFAPAYTRHVNAHMMQLGVLAAMCVLFQRIGWGSIIGLGTLAGFGFNLDFGSGPPLVATAFLAVAVRTRRVWPVVALTLAALPWIAAGLGLNDAIGGVLLPLNMHPEFLNWPGSPFSATNMTGLLRHDPLDQFLYAAAMWFGKHGFLNHNLPVLLLLTAGWSAMRRAGSVEFVALLGWCGASWLAYAFLSNNMGGGCCSIRWFVPFLAPAFWVLALILNELPERRTEFLVLTVGGFVLSAIMWAVGPWTTRMVPMMWPVVGITLLAWNSVYRGRGGRIAVRVPQIMWRFPRRPRVTSTPNPSASTSTP